MCGYGLFADASTITNHLAFVDGILPQGGVDILREQSSSLASTPNSGLSLLSFFGLALALWSANAGMKAIIDALNVVYEEREKRGFIKLNLIALALTFVALTSVLLAVASIVVLPLLLAFSSLGQTSELVLRLVRWPLLFILVVGGLAILYRFGPSRDQPRWQWISVGSTAAAIGWLIGSAGLSWYLANFADYDTTYGSLGAGIGLMMWMWLSAIVILFGAELNAETEHQTARDSTVGPNQPLGARGATMADTIGDARGDG